MGVRIIGVYARVLCEWSGGAPSYCILLCCTLPLCMYVRMYVCILQAAEVASQQAPSCEPLVRTTAPDLITAGRLQTRCHVSLPSSLHQPSAVHPSTHSCQAPAASRDCIQALRPGLCLQPSPSLVLLQRKQTAPQVNALCCWVGSSVS